MYAKQNNIVGGNLGARMEVKERPITSNVIDSSRLAGKALAGITQSVNGGNKPAISIRGAGGVVVEVRQLAPGTTAADVEAGFSLIFSKMLSYFEI
jgi:hypothetical protein